MLVTPKESNSISCGDLQKLARQISKSADYSDEGSGCERLSGWPRLDVRAEVGWTFSQPGALLPRSSTPPPRALCQSSQVHRISPTAARLPDQSDFGSLCKDGEKTSLSDYSFSTLARLRTLRSDLIYPTIAVHHGRIVKRTGDGSIIEFRSVVDAVRCAIEVQSGLAERNAGLPPEKRIEFRVGIHLGDASRRATAT